MVFISHNEEETKVIAETLGRGLKPGSIILAYGTLGAGKTCFAQGLAAGIGITKKVNSPTFNIIKEYLENKLNFYHIDAYRLEDKNSVSDIGFEEIFGDLESISYVEWPEFIIDYLKGYNVIKLTITPDDNTGYRKISLEEVKLWTNYI